MNKVLLGAGTLGLVALASITTFKFEPYASDAPARAATPVASVPEPQPAPGRIDTRLLDERLTRLMADPSMVGLGIAVIEGGKVRYLKGFGETLHGSGQPVGPDTVFRWASVSKGVASTMVALLAEDGKLSLDDPISARARSLRLAGGGESKARVRDLLAHRTGLHSNANDSKLEDGYDARWLRGTLHEVPLICPPASCHAYQNIAYDAASEMVEGATGKPFEDVLTERLFRPLGMASASATSAGLVRTGDWARAHVGGDAPQARPIDETYYRVPAAGGVNSSTRDIARWLLAQMGRAPRILSPTLLRTVHQPSVITPGEVRRLGRYERLSNARYALGWRVYDYAGRKVVGHRGGIDGYRANILFDPALQSGVAVLWNSHSRKPTALQFEVMDMIYALDRRDWLELDTPVVPPAVAATPVMPAQAGILAPEDANLSAPSEPRPQPVQGRR